MDSIGAIAALGASGFGDLPAHLPWAWFTAMALADVGLVVVVLRRRRAAVVVAPPVHRRPSPTDALVLRSGWRVPRSRALALRAPSAGYAWPLHREYMVSRLL